MHAIGSIPVHELADYKSRLIELSRDFPLSAVLDSNTETLPSYSGLTRSYDLIAGFSTQVSHDKLILKLCDLNLINAQSEDWYLGYLGYDLKNEIEDLRSDNPDELEWPSMLFFKPEILFLVSNETINVYSNLPTRSLNDLIVRLKKINPDSGRVDLPKMHSRLGKEDYLAKVKKLQEHIHRGDIYEVNFCMEFYNHGQIDPYQTFRIIREHTPSPFSVFFKYQHHFLLSASPERYICKVKDKLISQPIKGTAPRGDSPAQDEEYRKQLGNSLKERTENIMIADLVRNDLSRIARRNSVKVDELCGIYAYPHVYQMISTVSARLDDSTMLDIIRATFPMGSMTGAPKIRAMQLIEKYENMRRGLYSGAVGYISPGMDFDLNVVIRSLQYNEKKQYLSYITGSAITALADPENEYKECLLKAYAINPQIEQTEHA